MNAGKATARFGTLCIRYTVPQIRYAISPFKTLTAFEPQRVWWALALAVQVMLPAFCSDARLTASVEAFRGPPSLRALEARGPLSTGACAARGRQAKPRSDLRPCCNVLG
jgi:hypothetical protein